MADIPRFLSKRAYHKKYVYESRRTTLIQAVITLSSQDGFPALTIAKITRYAGCTRTLFYHYFSTLDDAINAAMDYTVELYMKRFEHWNDERDAEDLSQATHSLAELITTSVTDLVNMPHAIFATGSAKLYHTFFHKVSHELSLYMSDIVMVEMEEQYDIHIDNVYETTYILISGLISYILNNPNVSVETIEEILVDALHLHDATAAMPSYVEDTPPATDTTYAWRV